MEFFTIDVKRCLIIAQRVIGSANARGKGRVGGLKLETQRAAVGLGHETTKPAGQEFVIQEGLLEDGSHLG